LSFYGDTESGAGQQEFSRILWEMDDVTNTTKDSTLRFYNQIGNTLTDAMDLVGRDLTVNGFISTPNSYISDSSYLKVDGANFYLDSLTNIRGSGATEEIVRITGIPNAAGLNRSMVGVLIKPSFAEWSSGNHPLFTGMAIKPFTMTAGVATVSDTASLYIEGAATTTVVSGKNYSLWVDYGGGGGTSLIDGDVLLSTTGGNVGIGTTTPSKLFSVSGNSYLYGTAEITGALTLNATSTMNGSNICTATNGACLSGGSTITTATGNALASTTISVASSGNVFMNCYLRIVGNNSAYTYYTESDVAEGNSVALQYPTGTTGGGALISWFTGLSAGNHTFLVKSTGIFSGNCVYQTY